MVIMFEDNSIEERLDNIKTKLITLTDGEVFIMKQS